MTTIELSREVVAEREALVRDLGQILSDVEYLSYDPITLEDSPRDESAIADDIEARLLEWWRRRDLLKKKGIGP